MRRKSQLEDQAYDQELDRMRMMRRFPELPAARQEMVRTMRRVTETDVEFLHKLITFFVDNCEKCPTAHELLERAGIMRTAVAKPLGSPSCLKCNGTGWVQGTRMVSPPGVEPYEADWSKRCSCAPPIPNGEK